MVAVAFMLFLLPLAVPERAGKSVMVKNYIETSGTV
jgi:hypothetical protein